MSKTIYTSPDKLQAVIDSENKKQNAQNLFINIAVKPSRKPGVVRVVIG